MTSAKKPDKYFSISVTWNVKDIKTFAEGLGLLLTTDEAIRILQRLKENYDREYGITSAIVYSAIIHRDHLI